MLKMHRHRSHKEIVAQCKAQGVPYNDVLYRETGWDTMVVGAAPGEPMRRGYTVYNTLNGCFWGVTDEGVKFTSNSAKHDKEPWMLALLNFFYEMKD